VAGSPMEGTSGAADLALLRGRAGDAALGEAVRVAGVFSRRPSGLATRGVRADRVRGSARSRAPARVNERGAPQPAQAERRHTSDRASALSGPWPVNLGWWLSARRDGASASARGDGQRCPCSVRGRRLRPWLRPCLPVPALGGNGADGLRLLRHQADAGAGGERSARAHAGPMLACGAGIRRSCGRARGSIGLQKSTSGARSRPEGHGSSSPDRPRKQARSAGEWAPEAGSRRREPPASSDTGAGST
jgi:hypothetical protein